MTADQKRQIHAYARESSAAGIPTIEACPWPPASEEWYEWRAAYECAGMVFEVTE